jgi:hypothetical protein
MSSRKITIIKNHKVIRWIIVGLLLGSAVMLAFPVDVVASSLSKILAIDSLHGLTFLRLWLLSAPVGAIVLVVFGNLILHSSRLTIGMINFLRIAQWVPFLIVWTLVFTLNCRQWTAAIMAMVAAPFVSTESSATMFAGIASLLTKHQFTETFPCR